MCQCAGRIVLRSEEEEETVWNEERRHRVDLPLGGSRVRETLVGGVMWGKGERETERAPWSKAGAKVPQKIFFF